MIELQRQNMIILPPQRRSVVGLQMVNFTMYNQKLAYLTIWNEEAKRQVAAGGKDSPAKSNPKTLYPNILAELEASGWYLLTLACNMDITKEILWSVLEDGEKLTVRERSSLAALLGCNIGYISAPTLQILYMESNRGKRRRAELGAMLRKIQPKIGEDVYTKSERRRAEDVFCKMEQGEPVTFAAWRWAMMRCEGVLCEHEKARHMPRSKGLSRKMCKLPQ